MRVFRPRIRMRPTQSARNDRRGVIIIAVMMITMVTLLIGLAAMLISTTDLKITWNFKKSTMAFFAAEAGIQRSIAELREDSTWLDGFPSTSQSNDSTYEVTAEALSPQLDRLRAVGISGNSRRIVEVVVNVDSVFSHALNIGGDLVMSGKPRISSEGIRLNGNALLDLDSGTPTLNIFAPSSSTITYVEGSETDPVVFSETPEMDLNAARVSAEDWTDMASRAQSGFYYDNDGIGGNRDTAVTINNLNFDNVTPDSDGKRTIFVDGDVTLNGSIAGIGTIIANGKIIGTGDFVTSGTPTVSFIARDDVLLNFDTNAQSQLNGLTYSEGSYEMHGKIKYTGVVTAFGGAIIQNPSEFTNNNDPNYWYTYSAAYSVVSDPVDILLWQEIIE